MDFSQKHTLSFDCYGTLIDWEAGILACLQPWLARHGRTVADDTLLALYGELESAAEHGPFQPYKGILADVMRALATRLDVPLVAGEAHLLARSVGDWPAFPDTVAALRRLSARYDLIILSNVDEDLIALTLRHLQVPFQGILTAERIGSYKPSPANFQALIAHMAGREAGLLHCAQSRFHDIGPAKAMGLHTVWVDRRHDKQGEGATPPSAAVPDATVTSLAGLADLLC
jgi:2-haloalkanoic acid dehalogenase type II